MPGQFSETLAATSAVSYRMPWGTIKGLCWGNPKDINMSVPTGGLTMPTVFTISTTISQK